MIETPRTPKFLASGIGISGSRLMSKLQKKGIKDLPAITLHFLDDGDLEAFNLDAQLRTLDWLENELTSLNLLFLTADFGDRGTFDIFPDIMSQAAKHGSYVLVFPTNGQVRGKLGYHAARNDRIFFVEPVGHHLASQDEIVANGIKAISDMSFVPNAIGVDYCDIKHILNTSPGFSLLVQGHGITCEAAFKEAIACFSEVGTDLDKAKGFIAGIAVGQLPGIREVDSGLNLIREDASEDAHIIFGLVDDPLLGTDVRVSVFAFGFDSRRPV